MTDAEFVEHTKKEFPGLSHEEVMRMLLWYKVFTVGVPKEDESSEGGEKK